MREIALTNGVSAVVDDEDFARLSSRRWLALWSPTARCWYAQSGPFLMHRIVMGLAVGDPNQVDHVDPERTLDNRKSNLRIATRAQNQANRGKNLNNTSGYKGVSYVKKRNTYRAMIGVNGKSFFLGRRSTAEAAWRELYVPAAIKLHGEFARLA